MPLPTITDTYRVAIVWHDSGYGRDAVNVIHIRRASRTAIDVAIEVDSAVTSDMWTAMNQTTHARELQVTPLDGSSATFVYNVAGEARWASGASSGDIIPQVACVVKLVTDVRGRSTNGRIFLPFVAEGRQAKGELDSTTVSTMQAAWDGFLGTLATDTYEMVVASYKNSSAEAITSITVEARAGTQRRRQLR